MSIVNIRDVTFLNNPARFLDEYQFRVTFECIAPLKEDLEWKLIFVSSPDSVQYDQELDDCMVGPVPVGINTFTFSTPPPEPHKIPRDDVLGVAAVILTASYKDQEFVRVGYYQNTEYDDPVLNEQVRENGIGKADLQWSRLVRSLADKPRVTRFTIKWDTEEAPPPQQSIFTPPPFASNTSPFSSSSAPQQQSTFGAPPQSQYVNNNPFAQQQQPFGGQGFGGDEAMQEDGQNSSAGVPPAGGMSG